jgi:peroxiredoxin
MAARKQPQLAEAGALAPGFRLSSLEGAVVTLEDLLPRAPVLLTFFKVTCPVCQLTLPFFQRIHDSSAMPVYAISQNDPRDTRDFHLEFGITMPTLLDTEESGFPASNAYGISHVPTSFVIGIDGKIARIIEGWNRKETESLGASVGVKVVHASDNVPAWKAG